MTKKEREKQEKIEYLREIVNKEIKYVLFSTKILLKSISPISIPITIIANGPIILPTLEKVSTSKDGNCN